MSVPMLASSRIPLVACAIAASLVGPRNVVESPVASRTSSAPQLAFASHRDGNWEIYVSDADGRTQARLTRSEPQDRFPLWSPDQSRIAYGSQVGGDHWELWVIDAGGTNSRMLATNIVAKGNRQWSPDGTRIVFAATVAGNIDVFSVEVASGRVARLTTSPGEDSDPAWSPDGRRIVFSSIRDGNQDIYVMRADGMEPRRLTNHPALDRSPAWSPDGTRIAFISARDGDRDRERDIYLARVEDGRVERMTTGGSATNDGPRWSPDGRYLAVQSTQKGNYDIDLVRASDHNRRTIAGSAGYDGQFSWAPGSDRLAFVSHLDGVDVVCLVDLAGKVTRLTTTSSLNPEWSP